MVSESAMPGAGCEFATFSAHLYLLRLRGTGFNGVGKPGARDGAYTGPPIGLRRTVAAPDGQERRAETRDGAWNLSEDVYADVLEVT